MSDEQDDEITRLKHLIRDIGNEISVWNGQDQLEKENSVSELLEEIGNKIRAWDEK